MAERVVVSESDLHEQDDDTRAQLRERLTWTPLQRLRHLLDLLAFEERARRARRVG